MVNNLPTSWIQELLVSSMETNNEEGLGIYAINEIDPTRIFFAPRHSFNPLWTTY